MVSVTIKQKDLTVWTKRVRGKKEADRLSEELLNTLEKGYYEFFIHNMDGLLIDHCILVV